MLKEIMIVNPSHRPSKRKTGAKKMAKRRSARQKAATRKLVALNRRRARGPVKRRRRAVAVAPKRRRRRSVVRAAPARRRRRSFAAPMRRRRPRRRNPIKLTPKSIINNVVMPSAIQAGGAVGLDVLMGYANPMLPEAMKTGYAAILTKGLGAVILGMGVDMVWKRNKVGTHLAVGGLTVALHDAGKQMLQDMAPNIPMGDYNDYDALGAWGSIGGGVGAYVGDNSMGAYVQGDPWMDTAAQTAAQGVAPQFEDNMGAYV